ncbi:MAG: hypothetical protein HXX20_23835, partial [Chloroflexi bacterium]|nr:hypothetical protein [Chloroflexota bacterium]
GQPNGQPNGQPKQVEFTLPAEDTKQAGLVTLTATSGQARGETTLKLEASTPVEPVIPLVGGRAIIADAAHWSMVVVVPFDRFGNPVTEGTPLQLKALHPDGRLEDKQLEVKHLLGWEKLYSSTKAGRTTISAMSGETHGPEAVLLEVAGWPVPFTLAAEPESLPADGHQLMTLRTSVIHDKFGNILPDGTLITFEVKEVSSGQGEPIRRSIPANILGGVAEIPLQAPHQPGIIEVYGVVYGVESELRQIAFTKESAASDLLPITVQKNQTTRTLVLEAGPLLGSLGQFVPDGTPVLFRLSNASGQPLLFTATSLNGRASVEVRLAILLPGSYKLEVQAGAGHGSATVNLP